MLIKRMAQPGVSRGQEVVETWGESRVQIAQGTVEECTRAEAAQRICQAASVPIQSVAVCLRSTEQPASVFSSCIRPEFSVDQAEQ